MGSAQRCFIGGFEPIVFVYLSVFLGCTACERPKTENPITSSEHIEARVLVLDSVPLYGTASHYLRVVSDTIHLKQRGNELWLNLTFETLHSVPESAQTSYLDLGDLTLQFLDEDGVQLTTDFHIGRVAPASFGEWDKLPAYREAVESARGLVYQRCQPP